MEIGIIKRHLVIVICISILTENMSSSNKIKPGLFSQHSCSFFTGFCLFVFYICFFLLQRSLTYPVMKVMIHYPIKIHGLIISQKLCPKLGQVQRRLNQAAALPQNSLIKWLLLRGRRFWACQIRRLVNFIKSSHL